MDDITLCIGGEAGQGLDTMGQLLAKSLVRSGYEILVTQDYMSRIRGGHNSFTIRTSTRPLRGPADEIHILAAFTSESIDLLQEKMAAAHLILASEDVERNNVDSLLTVPFKDLADKKILFNVVALGCLSGILGLSQEIGADVVRSVFGSKAQNLAEKNLEAFHNGLQWVSEQATSNWHLPRVSPPSAGSRLMLAGSEAVALGAMTAGANFCSFYPMTPATGVALNLAAHDQKLGCIVEQAEDELSAVNMAIGASFAGAIPIVPTSGGGFTLMGEGISLAGMTETPLTIVLAQRPGPATGLPTRTEQSDLELALYSGHGEFPRAIMTPGTPEECFHLTRKAMDLAQRYQSVSIVITDQFLADSYRAVPAFDLQSLPSVARPDTSAFPADYARFQLTASGVSPRALPGCGPALVVADSDEHTPDGHITESGQVRTDMVNKRRHKENGLRQEVIPPQKSGPDRPDILLLGWGSSKGAMTEAAEICNGSGMNVGSLHFSQLWPLDPAQFEHHLQQAGQVICVEGNAKGQFAALIRQQTGLNVHAGILRYDGRPLTAAYIVSRLYALTKEGTHGTKH
ncbi:MAG: 2-oxoacid:acceptor oxidoreductase subunit alpha [Thermodesulfobacteriota bacterium]